MASSHLKQGDGRNTASVDMYRLKTVEVSNSVNFDLSVIAPRDHHVTVAHQHAHWLAVGLDGVLGEPVVTNQMQEAVHVTCDDARWVGSERNRVKYHNDVFGS